MLQGAHAFLVIKKEPCVLKNTVYENRIPTHVMLIAWTAMKIGVIQGLTRINKSELKKKNLSMNFKYDLAPSKLRP